MGLYRALALTLPPSSSAATHLSLGLWIVYLLAAALLVGVNMFFAASETALLSVRDSRISQLVEEGNRRARAVQRLRERPERMLVSIQVVVTLVTTLASSLATTLALEMVPRAWGAAIAIGIATIGVLFVLTLFGEVTPKNLAVGHAEGFALFAAPVVRFTSEYLLFWLVGLIETLSRGIIRMLGAHRPTTSQYPSEQEIKLIVEQGAEFGELEEEEKEMIHKVMEIPGIAAREIMTPRTQIVGVELNTPLTEVIEVAIREGHSRLPVYRGTIDDIVGLLHTKDLLKVLATGEESRPLEQVMHPALHIPESKKVDKLLQEFRVGNTQMAVVLDEYGGTSGVVTMEDVLEEIVGEMGDEYDEPEEKPIRTLEPGRYLVAGSALLEDVMEALDLEVNEEDREGTDTIGGLVFGLLGRVPDVGDSVQYGHWRAIVDRVDGRRIDLLKLIDTEGERESPGDAVEAGSPESQKSEARSPEA